MTTRAQERVDRALARQRQTSKALHGALTSPGALAFIKGVAPSLDAKALALVAWSHVQSSPHLLDCEPRSIIESVGEAAKLRLNVDGVLGHAYLVPFKDHGTPKAKMMIGFRGLQHLGYQSGKVLRYHADVVRENDRFTYAEGVELSFHHERPRLGEDRGERLGAYALAHLEGGGPPLVVVMDQQEIEARRQSSASYRRKPKESPWTTHTDAMWMKTAIRELSKRLPVPELQTAALRDEAKDEGRQVPNMVDLGEAELVEDEPKKTTTTKPAAKPEACPKCGRRDLREDGSCWDCQPDQQQ